MGPKCKKEPSWLTSPKTHLSVPLSGVHMPIHTLWRDILKPRRTIVEISMDTSWNQFMTPLRHFIFHRGNLKARFLVTTVSGLTSLYLKLNTNKRSSVLPSGDCFVINSGCGRSCHRQSHTASYTQANKGEWRAEHVCVCVRYSADTLFLRASSLPISPVLTAFLIKYHRIYGLGRDPVTAAAQRPPFCKWACVAGPVFSSHPSTGEQDCHLNEIWLLTPARESETHSKCQPPASAPGFKGQRRAMSDGPFQEIELVLKDSVSLMQFITHYHQIGKEHEWGWQDWRWSRGEIFRDWISWHFG